MPRRRCATASAKLSATRRPRASMSGSVVWASACPNSNTIACRAASMSARRPPGRPWLRQLGPATRPRPAAAPVPGPPAGLGESAHRERILAGGHLDLDPNQAGGRAVLPDAARGGIVVSGNGSRHASHVSGNTGGRQRFRKRRPAETREKASTATSAGSADPARASEPKPPRCFRLAG